MISSSAQEEEAIAGCDLSTTVPHMRKPRLQPTSANADECCLADPSSHGILVVGGWNSPAGSHSRAAWCSEASMTDRLTVLKAGHSEMEEVLRGGVLGTDLLSESPVIRLCSHYWMDEEENSPEYLQQGFMPTVRKTPPNNNTQQPPRGSTPNVITYRVTFQHVNLETLEHSRWTGLLTAQNPRGGDQRSGISSHPSSAH